MRVHDLRLLFERFGDRELPWINDHMETSLMFFQWSTNSWTVHDLSQIVIFYQAPFGLGSLPCALPLNVVLFWPCIRCFNFATTKFPSFILIFLFSVRNFLQKYSHFREISFIIYHKIDHVFVVKINKSSLSYVWTRKGIVLGNWIKDVCQSMFTFGVCLVKTFPVYDKL